MIKKDRINAGLDAALDCLPLLSDAPTFQGADESDRYRNHAKNELKIENKKFICLEYNTFS